MGMSREVEDEGGSLSRNQKSSDDVRGRLASCDVYASASHCLARYAGKGILGW
jgi:hypothetical protein